MVSLHTVGYQSSSDVGSAVLLLPIDFWAVILLPTYLDMRHLCYSIVLGLSVAAFPYMQPFMLLRANCDASPSPTICM